MPAGGSSPSLLPPDTRVGAVLLQVGDLDRSLAFYEGIIGCRPLGRADGPGTRTATLGSASGADVLLQLREKPGARAVPRSGRLGLYHFAVLLPGRDDLGRFVRHALSHGIRMGAADHLFSEAVYLVDPDGMTVEVYRDRPREEWSYRGGELRAASDPLDLASLADAAGPASWSGVPEGTRIGHMHFFVQSLPQAETFYVDGLGFAPMIRSMPGALFVSAGGYHHHVGVNTWAAGAPLPADDDARLLEWELVLPGAGALDAVVARLSDGGHTITVDDAGPIARDPVGNVVRLTAPAP